MDNDSSLVIIGIIIVIILVVLGLNFYNDGSISINPYNIIKIIGDFFGINQEPIPTDVPVPINIPTITIPPPPAQKKEVFNIDSNDYTYDEAKDVCKAFNSDLATYENLREAYKDGAHWCNYGWTDNQMALYPIQEDIFKKMSKKKKRECGKKAGINGGYFANKDLKFGVNCYGIKKKPDPAKIIYIDNPIINADGELKRQIYAKDIDIRPFNNIKWSEYSKKKSSYIINPRTKIIDTVENDDNPSDTVDETQYNLTEVINGNGNGLISNLMKQPYIANLHQVMTGNQSRHQSGHQSRHQSGHQSIHQSGHQSIYKSGNQSRHQSGNQSRHKSSDDSSFCDTFCHDNNTSSDCFEKCSTCVKQNGNSFTCPANKKINSVINNGNGKLCGDGALQSDGTTKQKCTVDFCCTDNVSITPTPTMSGTTKLPDNIQEIVDSGLVSMNDAKSCLALPENQRKNNEKCQLLIRALKYKNWNSLAQIKYDWNKKGKEGSFEKAGYLGDTDEFREFYNKWKQVIDSNGNIITWLKGQISENSEETHRSHKSSTVINQTPTSTPMLRVTPTPTQMLRVTPTPTPMLRVTPTPTPM